MNKMNHRCSQIYFLNLTGRRFLLFVRDKNKIRVDANRHWLSRKGTGELGYDGLNGTRKIGPSYAKSVIYI